MELGRHLQNTNDHKLNTPHYLLPLDSFLKESCLPSHYFFSANSTATELSWIITVVINLHVNYMFPKIHQE